MTRKFQHQSYWNLISTIRLRAAMAAWALALLPVAGMIATPPAQAQIPTTTFTTIHSFDFTDGATPTAALVQATNGDLYGTTNAGGANSCLFSGLDEGCGTVFKITPSGTLTTLHSFCSRSDCADGETPIYAGLVQATNGDLYGTTNYGGAASSGGTVFKITPSGTLTTLYNFCPEFGCDDGDSPEMTLIQAVNGDLYGTTIYGGAYSSDDGTVFSITTSGTLTTIHSFCKDYEGGCPDGFSPNGLVQAVDGNFYGTTAWGGAHEEGTVYKITASGTHTLLYSFCSEGGDECTDGAEPIAGLVQATNGDLYGTTYWGGANDYGTVFKITTSGTLTTLYSFCSLSGCTDGAYPYPATLIQATDGNLYGTTTYGGTSGPCAPLNAYGVYAGCGTVFKITPSGTLTTLYSFCSQSGCTDGGNPVGGLVQDTNGTLYGTTGSGGEDDCPGFPGGGGCGTVFSLSVGLGPFVETQQTSGAVGQAVNILGTNLTGATSVKFNGTAATFTVVSSSEITTTVPTGATTGPVVVVTPGGTLTSNVNFRVT